MGALVRDHFEGERVEAVAGQDRGRLVEFPVHRRLAATHVVIVHRRQVVMDQRIDMDAFQRERGAGDAGAVDAEELRGGGDEQRAQPLAAADRGMAHRAVQPLARIGRDRQQQVELAVHLRRDLLERRLQREGGVRHGVVQPAAKGTVPAARPSASVRIASIRAWAASSRAAHCRRSRSPRS